MKQKTISQTRIAVIAVLFAASLILSVFAGVNIANAQKPEDVANSVSTHKKEGNQQIKEERAALRAAQKQERRQQQCEKRKSQIESKIIAFALRAKRHQGVIDKIYERVQGFYDSGQLTVSNYDELKANVDAAQETASTEVAALQELGELEIDCTDPEVVLSVASFKEGLGSARDALKAYRKALVKLISSLRSASAEENANNTSNSSGEDEDEDESSETGDDGGDDDDPEEETETETETETNEN